MAKNDSLIVANYSKAFVESFAKVSDVESQLNELLMFCEAINALGDESRNLLNDKIPSQLKRATVIKMMKILETGKFVSEFIMTLLSNNRLQLIAKVVGEIERAVNKKNGISDIKVTLASDVDEAQKTEISEKVLSYIDGVDSKNARFSYKVDPKILGGIVVQVDSQLLDMSVKTRIKKMQTALMS